ncbi:MAG: L-aspartate oxidase [Planctomycetota bacterium]
MHELFDERRYVIPFRSGLLPQIFTGTLVVGSGAAGLRAAVAAASHGEVIVLAKGAAGESNTAWAQGGVAAVLDDADSFESHVRDTEDAGAGLCDMPIVEAVVRGGPAEIDRLLEWGMRFDRSGGGPADAGAIALGREGGHRSRRILHADGDATGRELQRVMIERVRRLGRVRLFDRCFALDLVTADDSPGSPVLGAVTWHPRHGLQMIWARSVVLATGGAGQVYRETTNPRVATADGLAMAYRVGATLADMCFVQFHPTVLYVPGAPRSLISEAVRGEGAVLRDASGEAFMRGAHELADLAPRDVVSRAIVDRSARTGGSNVFLDATGVDGFGERFPGITATLSEYGIDPASDAIPVSPAAHYSVGGVRTDASGRTGVPGLWAVGEAACSGLHGANRLASNSLLEGLVIGAAAGDEAGEAAATLGVQGPVSVVSDIRPSDHGELDLSDVRSSLRSAMWRNVGIRRTGARLRDASEMLDFWARYTLDKIFDDPTGWEVQNLLLVAQLTARSALWREESRGCHARDDAAETSDALRGHDCWRRGEGGCTFEPVALAELPA